MPTPARRTAFEILLRVETQASYASELLASPMTAGLSLADAALCTELVLGTLRWQGTFDFISQHFAQGRWTSFDPEVRVALRMGLYQLRFLTRMPARAAIYETVELVKTAGKRSAAGLVNVVLRKGAEADLASLQGPAMVQSIVQSMPQSMDEAEWAAIELSHPSWMLQRWSGQFGPEEAISLARANNQAPVTYLRPNPLLPSRGFESGVDTVDTEAELEERLRRQGIQTQPGNFLKQCRAVIQGNITRTESYRRGEIAIQDEASQMVAGLLDVQQGDRVLDLCAAPGNKTSQLAQSAGKEGCVVACDVHLRRLSGMGSTQKLPNINLVALDGAGPLPFRASFDRILVDAPCSGTGTLRRHPEIKWRLTHSGVQALAEKQLRLLTCAAEVLSAGGRMVYSTCSLEDEENRAVVKNFLALRPDFHLLPLHADAPRLRPSFHPSAGWILEKKFLETSPARDSADGFFAAILLKRKPE